MHINNEIVEDGKVDEVVAQSGHASCLQTRFSKECGELTVSRVVFSSVSHDLFIVNNNKS
jgi:hypothetical protein